MRRENRPLLNRHRVLHTLNAEKVCSLLNRKGYKVDLPRRQAARLDARINAFYMPSLYISYLQYGDLPITLTPSPARSHFLFQLPIRGHFKAEMGSESVDGHSHRGIVASPASGACRFVSSAGGVRVQVAISQNRLVAQLMALLGELPRMPLEFAPSVDFTKGYGRSLSRHVLAAAASLDEPESILLNPTIMRDFEQFIMTALLLSHPHNYSDALQRLERPTAPADVRRAIDYMEAHLDQIVTIADLAKAAGVPGRTLFMHFKQFKGISPMRYLRNARLQRAREALLRADPEASVTEIAASSGFSHMGRFSMLYRAQFGESPSQTLRLRKPMRQKPRQP